MESTNLLKNKGPIKVGDHLKDMFYSGSHFSMMTGDFSIYAFHRLIEELDKAEVTRLLFNRPVFSKSESLSLTGTEEEIKYRNELSQVHLARQCMDWIREKADAKALNEALSNATLYHVKNKNKPSSLIHGTSNFTSDGLGYVYSPMIDLNTSIQDNNKAPLYEEWFNRIWTNESITSNVKEELLEQLSYITKNHTPETLYFFTLYHIFKNFTKEFDEEDILKTKTGFKDTEVWDKLYKFQRDGVVGSINKLEKYQGCIIADSVGLGKTFEALAVIKYYELRNDKVLVLCPKKLRDNWIVYTQNDKRNILAADRFNYDVLNHTDLSRYGGMSGDINLETINWSNYDLVVIDESHNFRNNPSRKDRETRYSRLMNEVIKSGVKTKVLMLSATPVNNKLNDLKNQIAFITEGNDQALQQDGIDSINHTLRKAQTVFNKWSTYSEEEKTTNSLLGMLNFDYFNLLDALTIARSRKHIEKYYDLKEIGSFPKKLDPANIKAEIDEENEFPAIKDVNTIIERLTMSAYSPLKYVRPEKQAEYSKKYDMHLAGGSVFKQLDREKSLVGLMRINLLKRMESSIIAFGETVAKLLVRIDELLRKLDAIDKYVDESISISSINLEEDPEMEELMAGGKVKVLLQDTDPIKWKQDLESDKQYLEQLITEAHKIEANPKRDAKLNELKNIIDQKVNKPINKGNKKIIIFTAFADTAEYLYGQLSDWGLKKHGLNAALVTGTNKNQTTLEGIPKDLNSILTYFSPKSKELNKTNEDYEDEIDLLIATDCISEGQNLQDCDYLINYDVHWNPVRVIQRFGRIDRLGSENEVIQLVNFWPNMELNEYINLEARVKGRMVLLDISATGEENIIDTSKEMNDLEYRAKQLKQLQEEVINLEDISGGISITDLTLNDFKMDLIEFMDHHGEEIKHISLGAHAITSKRLLPENQHEGVIFCVKQRNALKDVQEKSPIYPFYLVFISQDGEVLMGQQETKQILDIYRKICRGEDHLYDELIALFEKETNQLQDMHEYKDLLNQVVDFILGKVREKGIDSLFSMGNSTILRDADTSSDDFELISYLIVK